jgi:hypothetical protein
MAPLPQRTSQQLILVDLCGIDAPAIPLGRRPISLRRHHIPKTMLAPRFEPCINLAYELTASGTAPRLDRWISHGSTTRESVDDRSVDDET